MSRINFKGTTVTITAMFSMGIIEARSLDYLQTLGGKMAYSEFYASESNLQSGGKIPCVIFRIKVWWNRFKKTTQKEVNQL